MNRTLASIVEADGWSVAEGENGGGPLVIRFRDGFQDRPDVTALSHLVRVVWRYAPSGSGMPDAPEADAMALFEDRLVAATESDQSAVLAAVITSAGTREWLFYVADVADFGRRLTGMPQEKYRYPIDLIAERDTEWTVLHDQVLASIAA